MDFQTLSKAQPALLVRAGNAWDKLVTDFESRIADFKRQVWNVLQEDDVWRGKASDAAAGHAAKMHKQMRKYADEMKPVGKALTTAGEELETCQTRLEGVVKEVRSLEPAGEWEVDDKGIVTGPSDRKAKVDSLGSEIAGILSRAATADREGAEAVAKGNVAYEHLTKVLAEERHEEWLVAKDAAKLASQSPDELSMDEAKRLNRLLKNHGDDPAFAGEFLQRVSPQEMLRLESNLRQFNGYDWDGPGQDQLFASLQQELGEVLATGTSREGSEYLGVGAGGSHHSIVSGGQQGKEYAEGLMRAAAETDGGYRSVGMLLHSGEYSAPFLNTVGDALIEADKQDGFSGLNHVSPDFNYVDDRGKGGDPLIGLMTALEHSPEAADNFFDPQRSPDTIEYLLDRDWPVDQEDVSPGMRTELQPVGGPNLGQNLLGNALESATLGGEYRSEAAARVMSETVHELASSDRADTGAGAVPPPMRDSVGHMISGYMADVHDASGQNEWTYDLEGEDANWASTEDGVGRANFDRSELYRVMGSAAYDPNAYTEMRNANTAYTAIELDQIASNGLPLEAQRGQMMDVAKQSSMIFGGLDNARTYAIDEFYDGKDAAYNSVIEAGGHLATWAVAGASYGAGGVPGAVGGAIGADAIDEVVNGLKQDSSNIVTDKTTELYSERGADAQRLLNQTLWEHQMWNEGDGPPIDWAAGDSDQPRNLGELNRDQQDQYEDWLRDNPYSVNQAEVDTRYNDGMSAYDKATGKTKVDYSDTTAK